MTGDCITCPETYLSGNPTRGLAGSLEGTRHAWPLPWLRRALAAGARRLVVARTARTLERLDDRTLRDIGVPRPFIREYARKAARGIDPR